MNLDHLRFIPGMQRWFNIGYPLTSYSILIDLGRKIIYLYDTEKAFKNTSPINDKNKIDTCAHSGKWKL